MKKHQTFQLLTAVLISGDVQNKGKQQLFKHRQEKKRGNANVTKELMKSNNEIAKTIPVKPMKNKATELSPRMIQR